jgi:NitT/TauT family transport system permease protein
VSVGTPPALRDRRSSRFRSPVGTPLTRNRYLITAAGAFIGLLVAWALLSELELVNPLFLPSPAAVTARLVEQAQNGQLWEDVLVSTYRVMVGYLIATAMAVPLGLLAGASFRAEAMIEPVVDFIRYMPVVAFIPLTILWVGTDDLQKFLIIWMGTFFQQVLMIANVVRNVPGDFRNLGATLGLSQSQILRKIVTPSALPGIWDALRVTLGWAWTWLVVAELVAANSGMGYRITQAQRFLATDLIIGYVIVLGLIGLVFDQVMRATGRKLFSYEKGQ